MPLWLASLLLLLYLIKVALRSVIVSWPACSVQKHIYSSKQLLCRAWAKSHSRYGKAKKTSLLCIVIVL